MKTAKIIYWISTGIFAAFMIFSAIPNIMVNQQSIDIFTSLGYPTYLIAFMGWLKLIGSIVILVPGFPRIKEWAYAGLFFDLLGATYSAITVGGFSPPMLVMLVPFTSEAVSYIYYHKVFTAPSSPPRSLA
ncbi:MAG: DoxX family protein [Chryseolinea sp.]